MDRVCACAGCGIVNDCRLVRDGWYCAACIAASGTGELPDLEEGSAEEIAVEPVGIEE